MAALLLLFVCWTAQPSGQALAFKLPAFLSSWIQQQPAAAGEPQHQAGPAPASKWHAAKQQQVGAGQAAPDELGAGPGAQEVAARQRASGVSAAVRRPFQSILASGKHTGSNLFSALPKSLFGRILAAGGSPAHQPVAQAASPVAQVVPAYWHFQVPGQFELVDAHQQAQFMARPGQQVAGPVHQQHQHERQVPVLAAQLERPARPVHEQAPKKHALGYGESNEDFVILNAQQVAELNADQGGGQQQAGQLISAGQQQQQRPASEEYREMPAIVIADPEVDLARRYPEAKAANESSSGGDMAGAGLTQVPLDPAASKPAAANETTTPADSRQERIGSSSTPAPAPANATSDVPTPNAGASTSGPFPVEGSGGGQQQQQQSADLASESPESGRSESAASAVVVASGHPGAQEASTHLEPMAGAQEAQVGAPAGASEQPEAMESFILGPYNGLAGDNMLVPPATLMEFGADDQTDHHQLFGHDSVLAPSSVAPSGQVPRPQLVGMASSFVQQARNLIQMPFSQPGAPRHHHQDHLAADQSSQLAFGQNLNQFHQQPGRPFVSANFEFARQQPGKPQQPSWPQPAPAGPHQQQHNQLVVGRAPQPARFFGAHPMGPAPLAQGAPFFGGQHLQRAQQQQAMVARHQPRPAESGGGVAPNTISNQPPQATGFSLVLNHGGPKQHQPGAHLELFTNQAGARLAGQWRRPTGEPTGRKFKSGLYQIEPPRLDGTPNSNDVHQHQAGGQLEAGEQQRSEAHENEPDGSDDNDNETENDDDENSGNANYDNGQPPRQHQAQQASEQVAQLTDGQRQQAAGTKQGSPPDPDHASRQVAASFGVSPTANQSGPLAGAHAQVHRGQVFSEPVGRPAGHHQQAASQRAQSQVKSLKMSQDVTLYDLEIPQQLADEQNVQLNQRQPISYLDTQVYTVPYTMTMQSDRQAHFAPVAPTSRRYHAYGQAAADHLGRLSSLPYLAPPEWPTSRHPAPLAAPAGYQAAGGPHRPVQAADWSGQQQQLPMISALALQSAGDEQPAALERPQDAQAPQYFHYQPIELAVAHPAAAQQQPASAPAQMQSGGEASQQRAAQQNQFLLAIEHGSQQARQPGGGRPEVEQAGLVGAQQRAAGPANQGARPIEGAAGEPVTSDSMQTSTASSATGVDAGPEAQADSDTAGGADEDARRAPGVKAPGPRGAAGPDQQQPVRSASSFCADRPPGLYADEAQRCKAYYQCAPTGHQMFRCNNQTQFNQKTQNCDWWYNVDCGGRLGSAAELANDDQTAASSTSSTLFVAHQQQVAPAGGQAAEQAGPVLAPGHQPADPFALEPPTSSTAAFPAAAPATTTTATVATSTSTSTTTSISTSTGAGSQVTNSSTDEPQPAAGSGFSERSSTTQDPLLTDTALSEATPPANGPTQSEVPEPRVGASALEVAQQDQMGARQAAPGATSSAGPDERAPDAGGQQHESASGEAKSRRLIQSEFGLGVQHHQGATKSARAVAGRFESNRQQAAATGELSRQEEPAAGARGQAAASRPARQGEPSVYAASAHQGSVSYMPSLAAHYLGAPLPLAASGEPGQAGRERNKLERRFGERLQAGPRRAS